MSMTRRARTLVFSVLACAVVAPVVYAWTPATKAPGARAPAATAPAPAPAAAPATASALAAGKPAPKPLLWKVSDADNALYLLGSFHLLKADDYPLSADVDMAFEQAERVVFEVPPAELLDPALVTKMQGLAGYSDGRTLSQVLPPDVHARLARMLGDERAAQLEAVEPWYINLSLLIGVSQQMGFRADQGLDLHVAQRAQAAGKPVSGLETVDDQLRVLDAPPMEEQVASLGEFFDKPAEVPRLLGETHAAWRDGDVSKLDELVIREFRNETPVSYRLVNVERNDAWLPKLRGMLDAPGTNDALVVVGAMHLLGADGVVEKLAAAGYQVERICTECGAQP